MSKYNLDVDGSSYEGEGDTMIEALKYARIFSIKKQDNGKFKIKEKCDDYFYAYLTKEQLKDLAKELLELSKS